MTQEPTFLFCVGATKAGTSWLHDHLSGHDDCYFRSIKELHYFGLSDPVDVDTALNKTTKEIARITDQPTKFQGQNAMKQRRLADLRDWQAVLQKPLADLSAYRAYLTDGMANAKVVGDVTPGYALLPESRLKAMLDVGKDVRILYLIRDPLARVWSHVRMIAAVQFLGQRDDLLNRLQGGIQLFLLQRQIREPFPSRQRFRGPRIPSRLAQRQFLPSQ